MPGTAGPTRIVVVDAQPVWREGLRAVLSRHADMRIVGESAVAADALAMATRLRPSVVLLDPMLRTAGRPAGLQLCRDLRSHCPDIHVLAVGPPGADRYLTACLEAGATGYLGRDVGLDQLVTSVRAVADGRRSLDRRSVAALRVPAASSNGRELTGRQLEVLRLLARGMSNRDIAGALAVSEGTVKFHLAKIMRHLDVPGRAAAVYAASRQGLI
jgi:two-component system, NarL family, response regulator DevR